MHYLAAAVIFAVGVAATAYLVVGGHPIWGGTVLAVTAFLASLIAMAERPPEARETPPEAG